VVPPATIADFTLVDATGNHRVGSWRNVTICVVRTDASLQSIDATIGAHKRILANGHSGVLAITIAERGAGIPSPALQRVAAQRAKELASTLLGSVVVVLADTALRAKDLDEAAALSAKQRAEDALRGSIDKLEQAETLRELTRMNEQLRMIQKLRKGK
jgi:hypothetical protein